MGALLEMIVGGLVILGIIIGVIVMIAKCGAGLVKFGMTLVGIGVFVALVYGIAYFISAAGL